MNLKKLTYLKRIKDDESFIGLDSKTVNDIVKLYDLLTQIDKRGLEGGLGKYEDFSNYVHEGMYKYMGEVKDYFAFIYSPAKSKANCNVLINADYDANHYTAIQGKVQFNPLYRNNEGGYKKYRVMKDYERKRVLEYLEWILNGGVEKLKSNTQYNVDVQNIFLPIVKECLKNINREYGLSLRAELYTGRFSDITIDIKNIGALRGVTLRFTDKGNNTYDMFFESTYVYRASKTFEITLDNANEVIDNVLRTNLIN